MQGAMYVYAARLNREVLDKRSEDFSSLNPDSEAEPVYLGFVSEYPPHRFEEGFEDLSGPGSYGVELLEKYRSGKKNNMEGVWSTLEATYYQLLCDGFQVCKVRDKSPYSVYCVLLDKAELGVSSPCVYVGMTSKKPKERLSQHKQGHRSNSKVEQYGLRLLPDFYEHLNPLTGLQAHREERRLSRVLKNSGFKVFGDKATS